MEATANFGQWVKQRRKSLDLTQQTLAERVGCSDALIRMIENGQRKPSKQVAELLFETLRIPRDERGRFLSLARGTWRDEQQRDAASTPHNLPGQLTSLFGREAEIASLAALLMRDDVRLVTVTGPPGVGKTRLALETAGQLLEEFPDGVRMVSLAPVREAARVTGAIAAALEIHDSGRQPLSLTLREHLKGKRMLLALDNFEHVIWAGPAVVELLSACPRVKALVTSREPLHVRGERQFNLSPLRLPDPAHLRDQQALVRNPAVALFVERAQEVQSDFTLTREDAQAVAAICSRMDGLPLAIELVAARTGMLSPKALLARLGTPGAGKSLSLLVAGPQDLPGRHQTLRSAIEWSYGLLLEAEQALFRRLGVFGGGFTLAAAEAVCNAHNDLPISVLEGMSSLLDKNMLKRQENSGADGESRFMMLETIREYAVEQLEASGEVLKLQELHMEYYLVLALASKPQVAGRGQRAALIRLGREHDNIRLALRYALEFDRVDIAARLGAALAYFWRIRGNIAEGRRWLEEIVERLERAEIEPELQAEVFGNAGWLASLQGDYEQATPWLQEGLALFERAGHKGGLAATLNAQGSAAVFQGRYNAAEKAFQKALSLYGEVDDRHGIAVSLHSMAVLSLWRGELSEAATLGLRALALVRQVGDKWYTFLSLYNIAQAFRRKGNYELAVEYCDQLLAAIDELSDYAPAHPYESSWLSTLADIARGREENEKARVLYRESIALQQANRHPNIVAFDLLGLGIMAALAGHAEGAATLFGALEGLSKRLQVPLIVPADAAEYAAALAAAQKLVDEEQWLAAWKKGLAMSLEEALAYALDEEQALPRVGAPANYTGARG